VPDCELGRPRQTSGLPPNELYTMSKQKHNSLSRSTTPPKYNKENEKRAMDIYYNYKMNNEELRICSAVSKSFSYYGSREGKKPFHLCMFETFGQLISRPRQLIITPDNKGEIVHYRFYAVGDRRNHVSRTPFPGSSNMTFSDFRKAFADEQFFSDQKQRVPIVSSELGSFDPRAVVHMATSNRLKKEEILKVFSEAVTIECEVEEIQDVETSTVCTSKLCSVFEGCKHVVKSGDLVLVDDSGFATNGDLPGALIKYWLKDMSRLPNGPATESQSIGAAVKDGPMFVATVKRKGYFKHHGKDEFGWDTHFWVGDKTAHELKVERGESSRSRALCIIKDALTAPPCYTFMFNDFGVPCPLDGLPKTVSRLISELNRWKLPLSCDWRFENGAYHVFPGSRSLEDLPPDSIVATPTKFMIGGKRSHRVRFRRNGSCLRVSRF
jgi:inosine/xanthosine triphosphate pyrophosphatase family protein